MLDKPRLDDDKIIACLRTSYGLAVTDLEFLALGYDKDAGVYRIQANGDTYFLKVKGSAVNPLSVLLPRYLKAQGIDQIIAPLPTITSAHWGEVEHFALLLYPFIDGHSGWGVPLADRVWIELGGVLQKLHAARLPPSLLSRMPKETFVPPAKQMTVIRQLHAAVKTGVYEHPCERQLAAFWKDHDHTIGTLMDRTEQLGRLLQGKPLDYVVCHSDIHAANMLIDAQDNLFIVDWDQPVFAPRERDLMFVTVGGFVTEERIETLFFQGYGKTDINPLVMAYYQVERTVEDLAEFAALVFSTEASDEAKQDSVQWFMVQFAPGSAVEAAHKVYQRAFDA